MYTKHIKTSKTNFTDESTNLNKRNRDIIETLANRSGDSFNTVLNNIILFCDLPWDVKTFLEKGLNSMKYEYEAKAFEASYTVRKQLFQRAELCNKLRSYLEGGDLTDALMNKESAEAPNDHTVIAIQSGYTAIAIQNGHAVFPENWIQLNPEDAKNSLYVWVVDTNPKIINGNNVPHFVFYSTSKNINDVKIQNTINDLCVNKYPLFSDILSRRIKEEEIYKLNCSDLSNKIQVNYFILRDENEYYSYEGTKECPYGAKIIH